MPESVACITVIFDGDGYEQGLVFACGTVSHALYVIQFNIWNCSTEKDVSIEDSQVDANSHDNQDYREISFSKDDIVAEGFAHTEQVHCRNSTRFSKYTNTLDRQPELIQTIPDRLKGMYDSEEKLYQQVKEHVFPDG